MKNLNSMQFKILLLYEASFGEDSTFTWLKEQTLDIQKNNPLWRDAVGR